MPIGADKALRPRRLGPDRRSSAAKAKHALERFIDAFDRRDRDALRLANAPFHLADWFAQEARCLLSDVVVCGAVEQRVIVIMGPAHRGVIGSIAAPIACTGITKHGVSPDRPHERISAATIPPNAIQRLKRPLIKLVALYHPEVFPLPRFALGISDLARAVRTQMVGQVSLADMQLGLTLDDIVTDVRSERSDIVGVSATFGQHDVLSGLLDRLRDLNPRPMILLGGSLAALNAEAMLRSDPNLLIARAAGEETIRDVVLHWHGDLSRDDVRGLAHLAKGDENARVTKPQQTYHDYIPELDLLGATLRANGVFQLESSRGCTHSCSFCPRDHKGIWSGNEAAAIQTLLPFVDAEFEVNANTSRKIFLVDEEFVGLDKNGSALARASEVARGMRSHGYMFETSSRVDQVSRPNRNRAWHVERIGFWRELRNQGLSRCLFGVESGVDSVLARFNKKTTGDQSAQALRTLTACGVPIRCTYISFDPLMTMDELIETYRWQGRTDLLLRPAPELSDADLFDAIQCRDFISDTAICRPMYDRISYMLVSMECLIGSPYLRKIEDAGLAGPPVYSMGKRSARYRDWRIGLLSDCAQRWVDRHFSFDYTLKSAEKLLSGVERDAVTAMRGSIKVSAYDALGAMIHVVEPEAGVRPGDRLISEAAERASSEWPEMRLDQERRAALLGVLNIAARQLTRQIETQLRVASTELPSNVRQLISREEENWRGRSGWELINEA